MGKCEVGFAISPTALVHSTTHSASSVYIAPRSDMYAYSQWATARRLGSDIVATCEDVA